MPILLSIDTALESASICLTNGNAILGLSKKTDQKDHAAWLHVAIRENLDKNNLRPASLEGIIVSIGPGSYTGLRIGLATAKGLCYALNIPLITVSTLEMIATAAHADATDLICPMIDARRMEVYMALYDRQLTMLRAPEAMIVEANSFDEFLSNNNLTFCGSGSKKLQAVLSHPHANFSPLQATAEHLAKIGLQHFTAQRFADLAYTEPFYLKDFHTHHTPKD